MSVRQFSGAVDADHDVQLFVADLSDELVVFEAALVRRVSLVYHADSWLYVVRPVTVRTDGDEAVEGFLYEVDVHLSDGDGDRLVVRTAPSPLLVHRSQVAHHDVLYTALAGQDHVCFFF